MKMSEEFPSKFLKAADLQGREVRVLMSNVEREKIGDDTKPVLHEVEQLQTEAAVPRAQEAARAVRGVSVWPEGLADGLSDWNDLHQSAGLDAVREPQATTRTPKAAPLAEVRATA